MTVLTEQIMQVTVSVVNTHTYDNDGQHGSFDEVMEKCVAADGLCRISDHGYEFAVSAADAKTAIAVVEELLTEYLRDKGKTGQYGVEADYLQVVTAKVCPVKSLLLRGEEDETQQFRKHHRNATVRVLTRKRSKTRRVVAQVSLSLKNASHLDQLDAVIEELTKVAAEAREAKA